MKNPGSGPGSLIPNWYGGLLQVFRDSNPIFIIGKKLNHTTNPRFVLWVTLNVFSYPRFNIVGFSPNHFSDFTLYTY